MWICVVPEGQQVYRTRLPTISKAQGTIGVSQKRWFYGLPYTRVTPLGFKKVFYTAFYTHSAPLVLLS